jgi:hypothetical protein
VFAGGSARKSNRSVHELNRGKAIGRQGVAYSQPSPARQRPHFKPFGGFRRPFWP